MSKVFRMSRPPRGIYEVRGQEVMARLQTLVVVLAIPVYLLAVVKNVETTCGLSKFSGVVRTSSYCLQVHEVLGWSICLTLSSLSYSH